MSAIVFGIPICIIFVLMAVSCFRHKKPARGFAVLGLMVISLWVLSLLAPMVDMFLLFGFE